MKGILAILLLGLGLFVLRQVSLTLALNLTSVAWFHFVGNNSEAVGRLLDLVTSATDVGFLIAAVYLGNRLLAIGKSGEA